MTKVESNTSEGTLAKRKKVTPEQQAENDKFDLGPYFLNLFWSEPFFISVFRHLSRIKDRKLVPTAGVAIVRDRPTLLWNPDFVASLPHAHIFGLLKHEAYHLIYRHVTGRRQEPHRIWNWACDLAINCALNPEELPEGGLVPGKAFKRPADEDWAEMSSQEQERFEKLSALIAGLETEHSAEWYFERLLEDETIQEMMAEMQAAEDLAKAIGKQLADALEGGADAHDLWGKAVDADGNEVELPDGMRQLIEGEIRQAIAEGVKAADGGNKWGSVPSYMQKSIRAMISSEVDWRALLRQFVGHSRRANWRSSRKKLNRKEGAVFEATGLSHVYPGRGRDHEANIFVYVDQSGSVDDASLELLYGELRNLSKRTTFHFFPFDTEVDVENSFIWKKGQSRAELGRFRCGGTSFQACIDHANSSKDRCDGVIILSDGECSKPTPCRVRLAYLICPNNKLYFEPSPGEMVIQMTGNKPR